MKQLTLAAVGFERYAKTTRRAAFLAEMERVVPWPALCALIEPFYPKPGNGRPPIRPVNCADAQYRPSKPQLSCTVAGEPTAIPLVHAPAPYSDVP